MFKKEKGGIFLGRERADSIEIIEATTPQKEDNSSRFSFNRKSKKHQKIAMDRWSKSDFTVTYFGEWHTHPQKHATPSSDDFIVWNDKLSGYSVPLILVVIGTESNWVGIMPPNGSVYEILLK